jgi:phosphoglycerate kinase
MRDRAAPLRGLPLLEDLGELDGRRVLVRADFNVPMFDGAEGRQIADDLRITATLPTLEWLRSRGATVVCCSHLGRPTDGFEERYSLAPVAARLAQLIDGVEVLENLRFDPRETSNDPDFVAELIEGFDAYVNDAFGASHRSHASMVGPPHFLPSAAGRLVAREVEVLGGLLTDPARPFVAIVGGAKVADKLGVLKALSTKADTIIVGGGMAFTFLAAQGRRIGGSMFDETKLDECRELLDGPAEILLPTDVVALEPGATFGPGETAGSVRVFDRDLEDGWKGLDVGPRSAASFADAVADAGTVLWNGPMGVFEDHRFAEGTRVVGMAVASCPGTSIVGGGDSARAVEELGLAEKIDYLSTGGGASLEFLEFGDLPALQALRSAPNAPKPR